MSLTLTQIVEVAATNTEFVPGMSSNELFYANQSEERLTDVIATIADAVLDKADLVNGKIPESLLPGYVDDVVEYTALASFPTEGESGKLYVDQTTNKTYRWSGTTYVAISSGLALGETAATAYRGDLGKIAYDHSQNGSIHVTEAQKIAWDAKSNFSGNYNDLTDKPAIPETYSHPETHPASMITGLADVATSGDYNDLTNKPVIPEAYSHPESHPASMITGLSEVATSGSYNDLTDKPTIPEAYSHPENHPASMITGLSEVATSGSYNDLSDKPTIPTVPSSLPANGGNADTVDNMHASDFATADHTHSGYADADHTHSDYASSTHTHAGYAPEIHAHSEYLSVSGGSINGDTNVNGVFRIENKQMLYYNTASNTQTIGTNNATGGTTIACGSSATVGVNGAMMKTPMILPRATNTFTCGNANFRWSGIYSTAAVNVSSDERMKRDIETVDADPLVEFVKNLNVVRYNYKDDPSDSKARIGLIAQQVQKAGPEVADFFVSEDENGMLGLKAADLVFPLILAVQRLSAELDELKSKM